MKILGISEGSHDACWCLIEDGEIIEAHHAERHSRKKNDKWLNPDLLPDADIIVKHEILENVNERRKWVNQPPRENNIIPDVEYNHHETHAWAGWATAPFSDCDILTIDAVGEWDTATVHEVRNEEWTKTFGMKYPKSYGMPYSYVTKIMGYKPMQDEYIVMGMSALWKKNKQKNKLFSVQKEDRYRFKSDVEELFLGSCTTLGLHGEDIHDNRAKLMKKQIQILPFVVQSIYEYKFLELIRDKCHHDNLIIMGGCALNCVANSKIEGKNIWIMPNPGDGGSALGAAARHYGKQLNWKDPYLGTELPIMDANKIVDELLDNGIVAVASGRAEFGPRALGNRSLLADPRKNLKDTIDKLKKRESWRPFAPAILEEHYDRFFTGPANEYMQFVADSHHPHNAVKHVDGSARVQIVKKDCTSVLRKVLELFYSNTGCPMLLNTSLNVKGEPIVDNIEDYKNFIKWSGLNDIS